MKIFIYLTILLALAGNGYAGCDCLEPFYKDKIDLLTRYTACLERCFVSRMDALETLLNKSEARILELDSEVDRLNEQIKQLESSLSGNGQ